MADDAQQRLGQLVSHERLYQGSILDLDRDLVREPGGVLGRREVVRQRGSVAALALLRDRWLRPGASLGAA